MLRTRETIRQYNLAKNERCRQAGNSSGLSLTGCSTQHECRKSWHSALEGIPVGIVRDKLRTAYYCYNNRQLWCFLSNMIVHSCSFWPQHTGTGRTQNTELRDSWVYQSFLTLSSPRKTTSSLNSNTIQGKLGKAGLVLFPPYTDGWAGSKQSGLLARFKSITRPNENGETARGRKEAHKT